MKGHKGHRKHRESGGVNEAEMDLKIKPEARTNAKEIDKEAEETQMKRGGRAKRKHGGHAMHSEMKVHGHHAKHHAGRKPRKDGGSIFNFTAHKGTPAKGRKVSTEHVIED